MPESNSAADSVSVVDVVTATRHLARRDVLKGSDVVTRVQALGGGVSNVVLLVESSRARYVIKQPLEKLRVAEDWRASRERVFREAAALDFVGRTAPGSAPTVVDLDTHGYALTMAAAPPDWRSWKELLLAGHIDPRLGAHLGSVLGTLHVESRRDSAFLHALEDLRLFEQLRIDPYHRTVATRHPDLAAEITSVITELGQPKTRYFVHGDFSPKNILVGKQGCWLIDFEVAHAGNPLFDVAFMTSHLVLKAVHHPADTERFRQVASAFLQSYAASGAPSFDQRSLSRQVGCLVLARVDGKSPVEYLSAGGREMARALGRQLVQGGHHLLEQWPR